MINIVGIAGASGSIYAARLIKALMATAGETYLIASPTAIRIYNYEMKTNIDSVKGIIDHVIDYWQVNEIINKFHPRDFNDIGSDIASGSNLWQNMIIVPSSMKTIASISAGITTNLIERCADVSLKERRRLIIVPRETPFNRIHLKNLLNIDEAGGIILPAAPGFYQNPASINDLGDFIAAKILNLAGIKHNLIKKWSNEII